MFQSLTPWIKISAAFILLLAPLTSFAAAGDNAVFAAYRAFMARDAAALARQAEKTEDHILHSYVRYWEISLRLETEEPDKIADFLDQNAGTALAEHLRREWLAELGKKGKWELFRKEFPKLLKVDAETTCYSLQERMLRQGLDSSITEEMKSIWKTPRPLPDGCLPVAAAMAASGHLSSDEVQKRLRLLLLENLVLEARRTRELYPHNDLPSAKQFEEVLRAPSDFLNKDAAVLQTAEAKELAFAALVSLSRNDLSGAAEMVAGKFQKILPLADQQLLWAHLAARGARLHRPEALEWFKKGFSFSGDQLVWRTRSALRQGDWTEVKTAIEQMPASMQDESAWTYWRGRSLCATGEKDAGKKALASIAGRHDFYGILAAEELGIPLHLPSVRGPTTQEELSMVAGLPGIARALAFYRINLPGYAAREWRWCVKAMTDRQLLAASELARKNGIWDRSVFTAEMTDDEHDFALRYPSPYREIILKHARDRNLDEAVVLGLVRQESLFNAEARSSAGATGLMQLMPETARRVARGIGLRGFNKSKLTKPDVNARLGTSYLRQVLDRFSANYALAAAAYNAGPNRAQRWKHSLPMEGAVYVESIPFTETRNYVKKVLANSVYYAALAGGEKRSLKRLLGTIDGRDDSAGASR